MLKCDKVKEIWYSFYSSHCMNDERNKKMSAERMQISLEEFIKYSVKQWKIIAVITMIFVVLFAGVAFVFGKEIVVPHSEEYLHYEQELAWHESYFEESILMNLDPTSIHQRTMFITNISEKDLLKDYAVSSEIWNDLETEYSKKYISELISWNESEASASVELILKHATSEECLEWAEYIKSQLEKFQPGIEIVVGAEKIVKDDNLQEEHLRWYSRIDYVNSLLLDSQAGYTIKVDIKVAIILGCIFGGILAIIFVLIRYLFSGNIRDEEEVIKYTGAKVTKNLPDSVENIIVVDLTGEKTEFGNAKVVYDSEITDEMKHAIIYLAIKKNVTKYKKVQEFSEALKASDKKIEGCLIYS